MPLECLAVHVSWISQVVSWQEVFVFSLMLHHRDLLYPQRQISRHRRGTILSQPRHAMQECGVVMISCFMILDACRLQIQTPLLDQPDTYKDQHQAKTGGCTELPGWSWHYVTILQQRVSSQASLCWTGFLLNMSALSNWELRQHGFGTWTSIFKHQARHVWCVSCAYMVYVFVRCGEGGWLYLGHDMVMPSRGTGTFL